MNTFTDLLEEFSELTRKPETFLGNEDISTKYAKFLKTSYDTAKNQELETFQSNALPELIIENFDTEQIWQQIELQNDAFLTHSLSGISKFVVARSKLIFDEVNNIDINEKMNQAHPLNDVKQSDQETSSEDDDDVNEPLNLGEESDEAALNSEDLTDSESAKFEHEPKKKQKPSIVDDAFFKLNEMEAFLEAEEKKMADEEPDSGNDSEKDEDDEEDDEENVDLFNAAALEKTDTERGGVNNPRYEDFFKEQNVEHGASRGRKRNRFLEEMDANDGNDEDEGDHEAGQLVRERIEVKSNLEMREERLRRKIAMMEDAAVGEKPWQLKGEITADDRPLDSLLEEIVEFDRTTRPAPVMTEQVSLQLEDIIRQRVRDKVFDSVVRKARPEPSPRDFKKQLVLDQEKSKQSLAQIYEKEYVELMEKDKADGDEMEEEEEPPLHAEVKRMMDALFVQLDALAHFHFTPRPARAEMRVVSNLPAITMEEVAPVATSDGALLAPEEVRPRTARGDVIGASERTATDRRRERRRKKAKQHHHAERKRKRLALGLDGKRSREDVVRGRNVDRMAETTNSARLKSSTAFFSQLEDEVKSQIRSKVASAKKTPSQQFNAKKLKL